MSIQVNTGASAVGWESLLNKIGDVEKTTGADGKEMFTVTMRVGDESKTFTFGIPDDLEAPQNVDQAAINSLCDKLLADKEGFNLTEEDVTNIKKVLEETLSKAGSLKEPSAKKSVLFDLYQIMALLVEVAQKQRDASREQRKSESEIVQASILSQASSQRTAAVVSMIASFACCAIQVSFSIGIMMKQGSAFKTQMDTLESSGLKDAKTQLATHTTELKNMQANVMHGARDGVPLTPEARNAKIAELKATVATDSAAVDKAHNARATDATYLEATRRFAQLEAVNNIVFAIGNMGQGMVQNINTIIQANATEKGAEQEKAREDLDQTKDLYNQAQELINQVVKLMQAIGSAESQSMRDAIQV